MKFIRVYGENSVSDSILQISDDGSQFDISDHPHPDVQNPAWSDYHNIFTAPINWNDGLWHSVVMVLERLNDTDTAPNLMVSVWWDDWYMSDLPDGEAEIYVSDFGESFSHIAPFVNWGATFPDSSMGIDMDNLEIWDGVADETQSDTNEDESDLNDDETVDGSSDDVGTGTSDDGGGCFICNLF